MKELKSVQGFDDWSGPGTPPPCLNNIGLTGKRHWMHVFCNPTLETNCCNNPWGHGRWTRNPLVLGCIPPLKEPCTKEAQQICLALPHKGGPHLHLCFGNGNPRPQAGQQPHLNNSAAHPTCKPLLRMLPQLLCRPQMPSLCA